MKIAITLACSGAVVLFVGLWMVSVEAALIVMGLGLLSVGVFGDFGGG